jgi:SAM-dependent methyltransferase
MANKTIPNEDIDYYDHDKHSYEEFWVGRDYEHLSEVEAIKKFLKNEHFKIALDYGGGYGRLAPIVLKYSDQIILADPSVKQLDIAKKKFKDNNKIKYVKIKKSGSIEMPNSSVDLLLMIRVSHHLRDPLPTFKEINRVLNDNGRAIIEIANYSHFVHRLKYAAKFKSIPLEPVSVGTSANGINDITPFVNHNPRNIINLLHQSGLTITDKLSVSNLRSRVLKKNVPIQTLIKVEDKLQRPLSNIYFGPSVFFYVKKEKN